MLERAALLGAGSLIGGGSIYLYLKKRPASPVSPSVPSPQAGLPQTLVLPAGSKQLSPRHSELLKFGLPVSTQLQLKENYVSLIDYRLREPLWVLEHLTKSGLQGKAERTNTPFVADLDVPEQWRATNNDYYKSGYSRGHMSPASNNKSSTAAMKESFLLTSNIVPQELDNNMFYWNRMERWVRDLVLKKGFDDVHVLSGPLFMPLQVPASRRIVEPIQNNDMPLIMPSNENIKESNSLVGPVDIFNPPPCVPSSSKSIMQPGKPFDYVFYKTIGEKQVAVPTHLFKAVLAQKSNGPGKPPTLFYASFIVPNAPIAEHLPLQTFQVSRQVLEKYAGFSIYDRAFQVLPVTDLCAVRDPSKGHAADRSICELENANEFKLFTIERDLEKVKTRQEAEKLMQSAQKVAAKGGIAVPSSFQNTFEKKLRELA